MQDEIAYVGAHAPPIDAHHVWAANPISLPHIRAQTRHWLAPLALDQNIEQDLVLAVNEAASNAIEHAYTAPGPADLVTVNCWTEPHRLCLEVTDHGQWRLPDATPGHRGHGILIMQQTVRSVFIHKDQGGTRVLLRHPTVSRAHNACTGCG